MPLGGWYPVCWMMKRLRWQTRFRIIYWRRLFIPALLIGAAWKCPIFYWAATPQKLTSGGTSKPWKEQSSGGRICWKNKAILAINCWTKVPAIYDSCVLWIASFSSDSISYNQRIDPGNNFQFASFFVRLNEKAFLFASFEVTKNLTPFTFRSCVNSKTLDSFPTTISLVNVSMFV